MKNNTNGLSPKKDNGLIIPESFTINGTTYSTALNLSEVHDAGLLQEAEALQQVQNATALFAREMGAKNFTIESDKAKAFYRIMRSEVYKKDFKSISAFAESIGVYVGKSSLSNLSTAGLVYSDKEAPDTLKSLPVSVLGALGGVINTIKTRKDLYTYAASPEYIPFTQATAKEYNAAHSEVRKTDKPKKSEVVHSYTAKDDSGEAYIPEVKETDSTTGEESTVTRESLTIDEYRDSLASDYAEVIDLPDKDDMKRILTITAEGKPRIFYLSIYSKTESDKAKRAADIKALFAKVAAGEMTIEEATALMQ